MTLQERIRWGIVYAPNTDDGNGLPSGDDGNPPAGDPPSGESGADGTAAAQAATQAGLTPEEIERAAFAATQRAIAEAQQQAQARADQERIQQQRASEPPRWDPTADALTVIRGQDDLLDDIRSTHPNLPEEAFRELRNEIRSFQTPQAIHAVREAKLHSKLADAALGKLYREGKLTSAPSAIPAREPVTTAVDALGLSRNQASELDEMEATLGVKFTKEERAAFARGQL